MTQKVEKKFDKKMYHCLGFSGSGSIFGGVLSFFAFNPVIYLWFRCTKYQKIAKYVDKQNHGSMCGKRSTNDTADDFHVTHSAQVKDAAPYNVRPHNTTSVATPLFFTRSVFFSILSGVLGFHWKYGVFGLWTNFANVCCITVFSIQEYSSFTGVMCRVVASTVE